MAPFKQERKLISLTLLTIVQSFSEIRSVSWTQLGFSRVWSEIGFLDSLSLDPTTQIQKMCCEYQSTNTSDFQADWSFHPSKSATISSYYSRLKSIKAAK